MVNTIESSNKKVVTAIQEGNEKLIKVLTSGNCEYNRNW